MTMSEFTRLGGKLPDELEVIVKEFAMPRYRKPLKSDIISQLNNKQISSMCEEWDEYYLSALVIFAMNESEGWLQQLHPTFDVSIVRDEMWRISLEQAREGIDRGDLWWRLLGGRS